MSDNSLTVRDNRTGQEYDVPITDGTIRAADIGQIRPTATSPGWRSTTPASSTPRRASPR